MMYLNLNDTFKFRCSFTVDFLCILHALKRKINFPSQNVIHVCIFRQRVVDTLIRNICVLYFIFHLLLRRCQIFNKEKKNFSFGILYVISHYDMHMCIHRMRKLRRNYRRTELIDTSRCVIFNFAVSVKLHAKDLGVVFVQVNCFSLSLSPPLFFYYFLFRSSGRC